MTARSSPRYARHIPSAYIPAALVVIRPRAGSTNDFAKRSNPTEPEVLTEDGSPQIHNTKTCFGQAQIIKNLTFVDYRTDMSDPRSVVLIVFFVDLRGGVSVFLVALFFVFLN